jgi:pimeloyl-ACP methyl ester carboxylesterase
MKLTQRIALQYIRIKFRLLTTISKKKAAEKAFELFCTPQYRNKKKLPPVFEKAEELQLTMQGKPIIGWRFAATKTDAENNEPVKKALIIHGFGSSVISFDYYVSALTQKGYQVLAFDAPAHGRSPGKKLDALLYKEILKDIITQMGPIHAFIAHSYGGIAISLALEELQPTYPQKLVLIAPATETTTAINGFFNLVALPSTLKPFMEDIILQKGKHSIEWFSIGRAIKNIKAKVLWLQDEDDDITPLKDVLPIQAQNHPHIQFIITKKLGHRLIYKDRQVAHAIINFL